MEKLTDQADGEDFGHVTDNIKNNVENEKNNVAFTNLKLKQFQ